MTSAEIAVIGGSGLARLWAAAGFPIILGSRAKERAQAKAQELTAQTAGIVRGEDNRAAAQAGDVVVLCVPYSNHDATLEEIKPAMDGKILVDAVVPLVPPKVSVVQLPAAGSPAAVAQRVLHHVREAQPMRASGRARDRASSREPDGF